MARTVLITGASRGIGLATARRFHAAGWNVAATMRAPDDDDAPLSEGERLVRLYLDVTDEHSVRAAVEAAIDRFGALDAVVNNAGYAVVGPFEHADEEQIRRQFDTNVFGLMRVTRIVLPHFRERRAGVFVNVASFGGRLAFPLYSLYHATKWAVEGFSESLQYELRPLGIRVKIVEPGPIRTDFYRGSADVMAPEAESVYDPFASRMMDVMNAVGRRGIAPEAVARTILRAASDDSTRLRYPVGTLGLLSLRRLLPDRLFHRLIRYSLVRRAR